MKYELKNCFVFAVLVLLGGRALAQHNLDSIYRCLDEEIVRFPQYVEAREQEADNLREQWQTATTDSARYRLAYRLYEQYHAFVNDSAIHYLTECITLAERLNRPSDAGRCRALLARSCSNTGMYDESLAILSQVNPTLLDPEALGKYYEANCHVYNELAYYTRVEDMRQHYQEKAQHYEQLMLATLPANSDDALLRREMVARNEGNLQESMAINDQWLKQVKRGSHRYALVALYRYLEYMSQKDTTEMMYWLSESALADVRNATMDQGSLWEMANQLMLQGDIDRSYRYISFTSDCTNRYGSRQRNSQIAPLLSTIANDYKKRSERNRNRLTHTIAGISILALLLMATLLYVNRQRKRLAAAQHNLRKSNDLLASANTQLSEKNQALEDVNVQLHALNAQLAESNKVKEEYVGRFMRLCSLYIDKMDQFRKRVNKMIKNHEYEALYDTTRGQDSKTQQLEQLYESFDAAFLHLFPDFVTEVNKLLKPEEQMELEKNKRMNTGLRILALIRLGIDDSSKIAEFLNYSVNTIYNYRARLKSSAATDRDTFEARVRQIGLPS
jgi:hypothetical protein